MRKPLIAGNWKLHKTIDEAGDTVRDLMEAVGDLWDIEIVVAPAFTSLSTVASLLEGSNIALAAQNCFYEQQGAYTGEVSPAMLKDAGCRYVILGHSERRQLFNETDDVINRKVRAALAGGLGVILCIGETLEERETDMMYDVLTRQIKEGLSGLAKNDMSRVVVAYEPVWAIGTGKVATSDQAEEAHAFIRGLLQGLFDEEAAEQTRILYGGSVKPDNIDGLMAQRDIDGALVGGASLKSADFARIVQFKRD